MTRITGDEYKKFLKHYNMKHGDQIRLDMKNDPPFMFMHPLDKNGYGKPRVDEDYDFKYSARCIVFSKGLEPSNAEIARINRYVRTRGLGLGCIFLAHYYQFRHCQQQFAHPEDYCIRTRHSTQRKCTSCWW